MDYSKISRDDLLKLYAAVESSGEAIFITDLTGLITFINPQFTKLYGFTAEEVVGKVTPRILKSGIMAPENYQYFWAKILNKEVIRGELINKTKDGRLITVEGSANPITDDKDEIVGFIGIQHDITQRKHVEDKLEKEQSLINALLDSLPDHVYFKDKESRFLRNSKSHAESFGLTDPAQAIGKSDFDFFSELAANQSYKDEQSIISTGTPINKEEKLTRKDNTVAWFSAMKLPLRDKNGNIIGTYGISRDITERKKSEEQFFLLANALKSINECVSITDMNDRVLFLNDAFLKTYGFNESDLKEESISKIRSDKNSTELVRDILPETLKGGWHGELWNRKKDGTDFMVALSTSVIRDGSGDPLALIGVANDITERRRMELFNQVIYEITKGVTTTSNLDELLKIIHVSLSKVVYAENIFVALHDNDTDLFSFPYFVDKLDEVPHPIAMKKSCTSYVFRTGKPLLLSMEKFNRLVEQKEVELVGSNSPSWVGIPLPTPSRTIGVLVLQHYEKEDIYQESDLSFLNSIGTQIAIAIERKQSEAALLESEKDLNDSQKIARLGSYKLNFKTGIWSSSKILDSIFGIDEKYERTVNGWTGIIHPEWQSIMTEYFENEVVKIRGGFDKEYKIVRKNDQSERWVHGRGELIFNSLNEPLFLTGNIIDITERKLAEEEISRNNILLQKINAEKDKFFSILAHDLRGPLSSFVAATQILSEDIKTMSLDEIGEISGSMKESATNIYTLLENLLEWSRLQRGAMEFTPQKINLAREINECVKVLSESARKKSIEIIVLVSEKIEIVADKHMFGTIIRNLVSNAIKFTKRSGVVRVEATEADDQTLIVKVIDTGIGMPADLKNKLFMLDGKTSRKGTEGESSTGLGLLLCYEFVEKHGGIIRVESEVDKGSTFSFTIKNKE